MVVKRINAGVAKYRQIRDNMNEGLKFYITLQDAISALKQQCGDYVMTRSIQCREMMETLQRQLAGLNFSAPAPQPQPQQPSGPMGLLQHFSLFGKGNPPPQAPGQQAPPYPPPPGGGYYPQGGEAGQGAYFPGQQPGPGYGFSQQQAGWGQSQAPAPGFYPGQQSPQPPGNPPGQPGQPPAEGYYRQSH